MSPWEILGWAGNACFFLRFVLQWVAAERAQDSVAPASFWWVSLAGAAGLMAYTLHREELVLFIGTMINGLIYARNLALRGGDTHPLSRSWVLVVAFLALTLMALGILQETPTQRSLSKAWLACVVVGQSLWTVRFVIQWMASERAGTSYFPPSFWWSSLLGASLLLAYAVYRLDAVLIVGYALAPFVPMRNLVLAQRAKRCATGIRVVSASSGPRARF